MTEFCGQNPETTEETPPPKSTNAPKRTEVLLALWNRAHWISSKIDNPRTKIDANLKSRVYFAQVETQIYRTILSGLQNEELEIRVLELEKKLNGGVLIERDNPKA